MSERYKDEDWLHQKHAVEGLTNVEIAEMCGVTDGTICYWKNKLDIESNGQATPDRVKEKISNSVANHLEENGHPFEGKSHTEESRKKMSEAKIGERNPNFGKKRPQHSTRMSGENNPSYIDGRTGDMDFRKQTKWKKVSFELKENADWTCENCGAHGSEAEIQSHHAIPVGQGGDEWDNVFIVLCKECHGDKTSFWHNSTLNEQMAKIGGEPINMMVNN